MNNIFANLYLVLQAKLKGFTIVNTSDPLLRHIEEDLDQLEDEEPELSYPACLVRIDEIQEQTIGENCKMGTVNVVLIIITKALSSAAENKPIAVKQKALRVQDIEAQVHGELQGWSPSDELVPVPVGIDQPAGWENVFGSLDRVSSAPNKRRLDLKVRESTYTLGYEDYSTKAVVDTAPVTDMGFTAVIETPGD